MNTFAHGTRRGHSVFIPMLNYSSSDRVLPRSSASSMRTFFHSILEVFPLPSSSVARKIELLAELLDGIREFSNFFA